MSFKCPECRLSTTRVTDSRPNPQGGIRRRRLCTTCNHKFTTIEAIPQKTNVARVLRMERAMLMYGQAFETLVATDHKIRRMIGKPQIVQRRSKK